MPRTDDRQTVLERAASGLTVSAPAKINLALHVVGRRADGYHLLESLAVFSRLGDRVAVEAAATDAFDVTGPYAGAVPLDRGNLVIAAREKLRAAFPASLCGPVVIRLEKNLPVASGLGGGSSDAAAALRALTTCWRLPVSDAGLAALGLGLGADVPMCLAGRPLIAGGIGETITPLAGFPRLHLVLVNPGVPVATPAVFAALASRQNPGLPRLAAAPSLAAVVEWLSRTRNDLEAAARSIAPAIGDALAALGESGALLARMSGSGASCFGLFGDAAEARQAAMSIRRRRPGWFATATESTGASAVDRS